jgi:predicted NUDIX family NTP pyrophosphohydrolase
VAEYSWHHQNPAPLHERENVRPPKRTPARPNVSAGIIPKGEIGASEDPEQTARREFAEELGPRASIGPLQALGEIRQRGGKRVIAFCGEGDFDPTMLSSNTFEIEWPPGGGSVRRVDGAEWFDLETAKTKVFSGQVDLIDRLAKAGL